jgi:hypothetical protein
MSKIPIKEIEVYIRDKRTNKTEWISFDEIINMILEVKEKEVKTNEISKGT